MKRIVTLALCIILFLCSCQGIKDNEKRLSVVTTIFPIYDLVRAVGGDRVDIKLLVDPGTEIHAFDPAVSDMAAIKNADLFLYIGGESESWVKRVLNDTDATCVPLIESIEPLEEDHKEHENHDHHDHNEAYDEHIWTSPENAIVMIETILQKMSEKDRENAEYYKNNANNYCKRISEVSQKIRATVENAPSKYIVVADRFPFKYLTEEYGIDYNAAFGGCAVSTDISVKVMTELLSDIKNRDIKCVFYVEMSSKNIANALAEETGVRLIELHSAHNVTLDDFNRGITYLDIMKSNQKALEEGLNL